MNLLPNKLPDENYRASFGVVDAAVFGALTMYYPAVENRRTPNASMYALDFLRFWVLERGPDASTFRCCLYLPHDPIERGIR